MALDIQFLTLCDHHVSGKQYREDMCPRCYGKGYYLDIEFDPAGDAITAEKGIKLQQELIKVLLDERTSDPFARSWGSELYTFIGKKNTSMNRSRLEMAVRRAIEYLQKIQEHEYENNPHVNEYEVIKNIEYIELTPLSVTEWSCRVVISNLADEYYEYSIAL